NVGQSPVARQVGFAAAKRPGGRDPGPHTDPTLSLPSVVSRYAPCAKGQAGSSSDNQTKTLSNAVPAARRRPSTRRSLGLEHRSDLALEGLDVRGEDLTRPRGVAGGDCPQQFVVLVHAREQMRQAVEHQVPDPQREIEVATERL